MSLNRDVKETDGGGRNKTEAPIYATNVYPILSSKDWTRGPVGSRVDVWVRREFEDDDLSRKIETSTVSGRVFGTNGTGTPTFPPESVDGWTVSSGRIQTEVGRTHPVRLTSSTTLVVRYGQTSPLWRGCWGSRDVLVWVEEGVPILVPTSGSS